VRAFYATTLPWSKDLCEERLVLTNTMIFWIINKALLKCNYVAKIDSISNIRVPAWPQPAECADTPDYPFGRYRLALRAASTWSHWRLRTMLK
jgi:hypothetical protein